MINYEEVYLAHHGIKGQRWGVRRFQNPDGSLTSAGAKRYAIGANGKLIKKKGVTRSSNRYQIKRAKQQAKLERVKAKEAAKTEKYKEKLEAKKTPVSRKDYVKSLSNEELSAINKRDALEATWLKNHPEKKTVGKYLMNDVIKPSVEKAMKKQVDNYIDKFVDKTTKSLVDSILADSSKPKADDHVDGDAIGIKAMQWGVRKSKGKDNGGNKK